MNRTLRSIILLIACMGIVAWVGIEPASGRGPRIAWLDEHIVPLISWEAGHGFADLEPLEAMIGDARIVGLGESTHGTCEHFQMKRRPVEYLVEQLEFTWLAVESSTRRPIVSTPMTWAARAIRRREGRRIVLASLDHHLEERRRTNLDNLPTFAHLHA